MLYTITLYCILLLYAVYYYCILTSNVHTYIHLPLSVLLTLLVYARVCSVLDWCSCINRALYKGSLLVQRQLAAFKGGDHDVKIDVLSETHSLIALQGMYIHTLCLHNLERHPLLCQSLWSHWVCYRQRMEQAAWAVYVCTYLVEQWESVTEWSDTARDVTPDLKAYIVLVLLLLRRSLSHLAH